MLPPTDLRDYADARGLSHRGQSTQIGWMVAFGMSEELQFNVLRGTLPGGEDGVVFHDVKVLEAGGQFGLKYGEQISGFQTRVGKLASFFDVNPFSDYSDQAPLFKVAYTTAAIRVPEASGLIVGLSAARPPERGAVRMGPWTAVDGLPRGWEASVRDRATRAAVEEFVSGPLAELLAGSQPLGFEVLFRFGTLVVSQQHFATEAEVLDKLCEKASWLAGELRHVCERHARPLGFGVELPEPDWLADVRTKPPGDTFLGADAQNLGSVVQLADATGMALEDAFDFMRGFAYVPVPGEAFGVLRGTLPGTGVNGRIVSAIERPAWENKPLQKALDKKVGGPFGCDAVLVAVGEAAPETPGTAGEQWIEGGRVAIKRGVLAAWRKRERVSVQQPEVEALVADTLQAVQARGLVC